jgi:hypothetical protein
MSIFKDPVDSFYEFDLNDGFFKVRKPQKFQFIDSPKTKNQEKEYKNQTSITTRLHDNNKKTRKGLLTTFYVKIHLRHDDTLQITLPGCNVKKAVRAFQFYDYIYNDNNEKRMIFDAKNDFNNTPPQVMNTLAGTEARILSKLPFCKLSEMLPSYPDPDTFIKKLYPVAGTRGLAWSKDNYSSNFAELYVYDWAASLGSKKAKKLKSTGLKCKITDNEYYDLLKQFLFIEEDKKGENISFKILDKNKKPYPDAHGHVKDNIFFDYDFEQYAYKTLLVGEMLATKDKRTQLVFEPNGALVSYEIGYNNKKTVKTNFFTPSEALKKITMKFTTMRQANIQYFRLEIVADAKTIAFSRWFPLRGLLENCYLYFNGSGLFIHDDENGGGEIKVLCKEDKSRL